MIAGKKCKFCSTVEGCNKHAFQERVVSRLYFCSVWTYAEDEQYETTHIQPSIHISTFQVSYALIHVWCSDNCGA